MTLNTQAMRSAPDRFSMLFPSVWRRLDARVALRPATTVPRAATAIAIATTTTTAKKKKTAPPEVDAQAHLQAHLAAHYTVLHRRLERQLGCADLASECLHDAWLRLGEGRTQEAPANPDAYVYRVACNLAMDSLRARKRWTGLNDEGANVDVIADLQPGPELIAEARSEVAAVDRAMQRLPRRHQSVLLALRWHEMSRQEVARRHGVSVRKIDTALRQALGVLR